MFQFRKLKPTVVSSLSTVWLLLSGCAHSFDRTVEHVDRDRFMGTWYVVAGRFTMFEKDVHQAVEKYTWNEAQQQIDIDFSYRKGSLAGELKKIPQTGWIENQMTQATWKVSPFWPLRFTYLVIALDPNYEWTAIGVPNQNYLWVMARQPVLPKAKLDEILKQVAALPYSVEDIVFVENQ